MIEAVQAAMTEEMERDERVLVMGEDVGRKGGVFGATDGLHAKFGEARVLEVYAAARQAVTHARSGGGPTLIEVMVPRLTAHSSDDR